MATGGRSRVGTVCIAIVTVASVAAANGEPPRRVPRCAGEIRVDGELTEADWDLAMVVELPVEVDPGENTAAPVRTEALVIHDDSNVYVGFRAYAPEPSLIRAHLADRDNAWSDDWVGSSRFDPVTTDRTLFAKVGYAWLL